MYTHIEDYIHLLYKSIGVITPADLDMRFIAKQLGAKIVHRKSAFRFDDEIILTKSTKRKEWMEFGHEACHYLRHAGSQLNMSYSFWELQEWQADNFAYHFCIPTFMLDDYEFPYYHGQAIQQIAHDFNVTIEFARTRFYMYQDKKLQLKYDKQFQHSLVASQSPEYSAEDVMNFDFNLDNEILPEEVYQYRNFTEHKEKIVKGTTEFMRRMRKKGLL